MAAGDDNIYMRKLRHLDRFDARIRKNCEKIKNRAKRKTVFLKEMVDEAKTFNGVKRLRLEKDESKLLGKYMHIINKEHKHIDLLESAFLRSWRCVEDILGLLDNKVSVEFKNAPGNRYDSWKEAKSEFDISCGNLFKLINHRLVDLDKWLVEEKRFVERWHGRSIFFDAFVSKKHILDNFSGKLKKIYKYYKEQDAIIQKLLDDLPKYRQEVIRTGDVLIKKSKKFSEMLDKSDLAVVVVTKIKEKVAGVADDSSKGIGTLVLKPVIGYGLGSD